jgi:protein-S-isoprenylcysteine O-methyltransferase Ste14
VTATFIPFVFPLLAAPQPGPGRQLAADLLLIAGNAWAVWALRSLGRNLSVLAQTRQLADRGPYRWVRHPLYLGEIVASLGLALVIDSIAATAVWLLLCVLQAYRALAEERLLQRTMPEYAAYRRRTAALLPGIF